MADQRPSVLITGCSPGGIGNALALAFSSRGFRVFATARRPEVLSDLQAKGLEALSLTVDDASSVRQCHAEVEKRLNGRGLDYLVHNAGISYLMPAADHDMAVVRRLFETNLFGIMDMTSVFTPLLIQAHGTVALISSIAGVVPTIFNSTYSASKGALNSYADCLRLELSPFGVHVVSVLGGLAASKLVRNPASLPDDSLYKAHEQSLRDMEESTVRLGIKTELFAQKTVAGLLNSRGWLWSTNELWPGTFGTTASILRAVNLFVPGGMFRFLNPLLRKPVPPKPSKQTDSKSKTL